MRSLKSPLYGIKNPFGKKRGGITVSIGSGLVITGTELTATVNGLVGGETVTYQWTDDGVNITGATASTYTVAIGTDSVADASAIRCVATVDGTPYTSGARVVAYAAGTASAIADGQTFTVDSAITPIDAAASGANLTFSYALSGAPAGLSINSGTGSITGTPTAASSGTATITATDQYGRTYVDTFTFTASLRTQATGGTDLDLAFPEDSAITATNLIANWTANGNTLTFVSVSPSLPTGLSIDSAGEMTGTPTTITADATYTLTMQDEYGRQTSDTFTLEITEAISAAMTGGVETLIDVSGTYYRVHTFNESGTLTVNTTTTADYVVVGGGGGGGGDGGFRAAGGGGAGQFISSSGSITAGSVSVTIGAGGTGSTGPSSAGADGGSTSLGAIATAVGGGGGGTSSVTAGRSGASGGGGGSNNTPGAGGTGTAGNDGGDGAVISGYAAGGGGGSGGLGVDGAANKAGDGGAGTSTSIRGTSESFAGGGGGAMRANSGHGVGAAGGGNGGSNTNNSGNGFNATPNSGSGGGGAGGFSTTGRKGGNGGSGVVIVRYEITEAEYLAG